MNNGHCVLRVNMARSREVSWEEGLRVAAAYCFESASSAILRAVVGIVSNYIPVVLVRLGVDRQSIIRHQVATRQCELLKAKAGGSQY